MSQLLKIASRWTEKLPTFTLRAKVNNAWVPIDLSLYDVEIDLLDDLGAAVSATGTVTQLAQSGATEGQLDYVPGEDDFVPESTPLRPAHSYAVRWKLTRISDSKVSYVPNGGRDTIVVYE